MKFLVLIILIFSISCSKQDEKLTQINKVNEELSVHYSEEDKKLVQCAQSVYKKCSGIQCQNLANQKCLKNNPNRNPASAMMKIQAQQMIDVNSWFFLSSSMINNFYNFFQAVKKANQEKEVLKKVKESIVDSFHGVGIGISGSAFFGANKNWSAELIHHNKEIALFCAPGNGISTDGGVTLGAVGVTTLGCKTHDDYEGTFLSGSFGVSGEIFLVPLGAEIAYSFGMNSDIFNQKMRALKQDQEFDFRTFMYELKLVQAAFMQGNHPFVFQALGAIGSFVFKQDVNVGIKELDTSRIKSLLKRQTSIGQILKEFHSSQEFKDVAQRNGLTHIDKVLDIFASSFTGCDSFAGSASLSLSASPISFGLNQSYYTRVITIKGRDAKILGALSLASLANPIFLSPTVVPLIIKYASRINNIDDKIKNCISADIKDFENFVIFKD